jgi:hypothetical protein
MNSRRFHENSGDSSSRASDEYAQVFVW